MAMVVTPSVQDVVRALEGIHEETLDEALLEFFRHRNSRREQLMQGFMRMRRTGRHHSREPEEKPRLMLDPPFSLSMSTLTTCTTGFINAVNHASGNPITEWARVSAQGRSECAPELRLQLVVHKNGVQYPAFVREQAMLGLKSKWSPRSGDVVIASHFPVRGLQRAILSLVEGRDNPWEKGLLDRPFYLEGGVSKRGVEEYLATISQWSGRRCFKTHTFPENLPCVWPPEYDGEGTPPKIIVLVADPRFSYSINYEVYSQIAKDPVPFPVFIEAVVEKRLEVFGNLFAHSLAWAEEAAARPRNVRLFVTERFSSIDPRQAKSAFEELAEFLEVPDPAAAVTRLLNGVYNRPQDAAEALAGDDLRSPEAINGGPLLELVGPRLQAFQDSLQSLRSEVQAEFRQRLNLWVDSNDYCLSKLGETAAQGVNSLMPLKLMWPMKGDVAHEAGQCRPCVFALRGACRETADMCAYCHLDGHQRTKRASRAKRDQKKAQARVRTPSLEGLSS